LSAIVISRRTAALEEKSNPEFDPLVHLFLAEFCQPSADVDPPLKRISTFVISV
jgi:hypothetical protein